MKATTKRARCSECQRGKSSNAFSRNQLKKGRKRKCSKCVNQKQKKRDECKHEHSGQRKRDEGNDKFPFFASPQKDQTSNQEIYTLFGDRIAHETYARTEKYTIHGYLRRLSRLSSWEIATAPAVEALCLSYYLCGKWDTVHMHRNMDILENHRLRVRGKKRMTTYLAGTVRNGVKFWIFQLDKYPGSGVGPDYAYKIITGGPPAGAVRIGVCKANDMEQHTENAHRRFLDIIGYDVDFQTLSDFREYGQYCNEGDVIAMELDMNARTLSFSHNDTFHGVAFKELEQCEYKAAISVQFAHNTIVRLCDER